MHSFLASDARVALMRAFVCAIVIFGLAPSAHAFTWLATPPPVTIAVDDNNVDLGTGSVIFSTTEVVIGQPDSGGLVYARTFIGTGWRDNLAAGINSASTTYTVSIGGSSETFTLASGVFTSDQGSGSTLTFNAGTQIYTYINSAGVQVLFDKALAGSSMPWNANEGRVTRVETPAGLVTTYHYVSATVSGSTWRRLQSVTNNRGYQLHLEYSLNAPTVPGDLAAWQTLSKVTGLNNAVDYCSPTATSCTGLTQTWPSATYAEASGIESVTNTTGDVTRYVFTSGQLTGIRRPTSPSTNTITFARSSGRISSVVGPGGTWTYAYADASGIRTTTATNSDSLAIARVALVEISSNRVQSFDSDGATWFTYAYDGQGRLTEVFDAINALNTELTYDARGNVTEIERTNGVDTVTTSATFASTCSNVVTCNQPETTTDARGFVTDYAYDSGHGGVTAITLPDPDGAGPLPRPETRFSYASLYAYYKNSGGTIVAAASPVTLVSSVSSCATTSSCSGGADETITSITYGAPSVANNLLPTAVSSGAGDASLTATTTTTYTANGDVETMNGPLSGSDDTTRFRYDDARRTIGMIGPDPDAGGALKHRAIRTTYNADGQATLVEVGTVDSQSDPDWAAFAALEASETSYDAQGRPIRNALIASSTTYAVTQTSYDAIGRAVCSAVRMNPAVFGSLPGSACSLSTQGSHGPDRITQQTYDVRSRPLVTTTGYATASPIAEASFTYQNFDDLPETLTDAEGNVTQYEYGFLRRLGRITYANASGGGVNLSDYEAFTYNAAGQVTQFRRRDASTISTSYDNLGRPTLMDVSTGTDVTTAYDNFSRVTETAFSGHTLSYVYDQLSRLTSETGPLGAVSYQYDLASRRTRMTWPDSFYVTYDNDLYDEVTAIRENGAGSGIGVLAIYAYDNLGRRTSLTRGNGVVTNYGYDSISRMTSLASDLASSGDDDSRSFSFNPAFQISSRTLSDNDYAQAFAIGGATYQPNGLNQYANVSSTAFSYDARGNLTSDGTNSYGYDIHNRLTSRGGATLGYDPQGRLYQTVASSVTTRLQYDGVSLIGEYNGSNVLQRRYVHGPAIDEPIVWYEGSNTSDRRWLIADERGSISAITNASGAATNINVYDEYGVPGSSNVGRFQYTGQQWLADAGVYYYRARVYAPALGDFLQTDPLGVSDGANLYGYVHADPINFTDPEGKWVWFVAGALIGAGTDLAIQLRQNNNNWSEIDTTQLVGAALFGSIGGFAGFAGRAALTGTAIVAGRQAVFNSTQRIILGAHAVSLGSTAMAGRYHLRGENPGAGAMIGGAGAFDSRLGFGMRRLYDWWEEHSWDHPKADPNSEELVVKAYRIWTWDDGFLETGGGYVTYLWLTRSNSERDAEMAASRMARVPGQADYWGR